MYNLQIKTKKQQQLHQERLKAASLQRFVSNYYENTRPSLLVNHNKRVNDFIKKIEHQPIIIKLDPDQVVQQHSRKKNMMKTVRMRDGRTTRKHHSSCEEHPPVNDNFKFKNSQDWTSLFTSCERLEREKNYQIFKTKYGDPSLAFRSIGSQSDYRTTHNFRERFVDMEIHPPMKYTNKPTEQVLVKLKQKIKKERHVNKILDPKPEHDKQAIRSLVQSSVGDDLAISIDNSESFTRENEHREQDSDPGRKNSRKAKRQGKMYFKQVQDILQNNKDERSKRILRDILQKCGLYRKKNLKAVTENDVDEFDKLDQ